jgi:tetratricopeptide (TPR) repeat protein
MMECTNPGLFSAGPDWLDPGEQRRHEALWQVARGRAEGEGGAFRRHVGECPACAHLVESFRRLDKAVAEGAEVFAACPSAKDLSDYQCYELPVDEREKVDAHLKECPCCREDLAWLARTAESKVVAMPRRRWAIFGVAAAALVLLALIAVRHAAASRYADLAQIPALDRGDLMATLEQPERFHLALEDSLNAYDAGDYRKAEANAEAILWVAPADPSALLVKAMAEYRKGNTTAAVALMDQSERTQPMSAFRCWAALQLGLATANRGRVDRECKHLEGHPRYSARAREIQEAVRKRG